MKAKSTNHLFPVFLKLDTLTIMVIGGGKVALEKLSAILNNEPKASVRLVSPEFHQEIIKLAKRYKGVSMKKKKFAAGDLKGADLVISAVDDVQVTRQIRKATRSRGLLLNAADKPDLCDFYLGSIVQKGNLKLGISTNGKSPTLAKRLKEVLNETIPDEIDEVLENLEVIRKKLKGDMAGKIVQLNKITSILAGEKRSRKLR